MADLVLLTAPALAECGVVHGFTTRRGGVSTGALASLNLARRPGESDDHLRENWRRVASSVGRSSRQLALLEQVHGSEVVTVERGAGPLDVVAAADGAISTNSGVLLAVRVADCVPVLFAAPGGVGVAHAGWRGVAGGVAPATAAALAAACGVGLEQVVAVIGPCIAAASYETGPTVVDAVVAGGVPREVVQAQGPWEREHADLRASVAWQLASQGVAVHHVDCDTASDARFFSHRAHRGDTGRLAGVIGLASPA